MDMILQNCDIARREKTAVMPRYWYGRSFMFVGQDVFIDYSSSKYKNFEDAINTGVADAYKDAYLRKSVVTPLSRKNNK
jgi:fumarate hydratase subunit alpha